MTLKSITEELRNKIFSVIRKLKTNFTIKLYRKVIGWKCYWGSCFFNLITIKAYKIKNKIKVIQQKPYFWCILNFKNKHTYMHTKEKSILNC